MLKFIMSALFLSISINSYAEIDQIEVIGLVPGVSTKAEVEKSSVREGWYVIGGFELLCIPSYIDNVLSMMFCKTGKKLMSKDIASDSPGFSSNVEVHNILVNGLVKKFGIPPHSEFVPLQNRFGTALKAHVVQWTDRKGNEIALVSRTLDDSAVGALIMHSKKHIDNEAEKKKSIDQNRGF